MMDNTLIAAVSAIEIPTIGFFTYIVRKLNQHDIALALLIQQVNPPGEKSLRAVLNEIQIEDAHRKGQAETSS